MKNDNTRFLEEKKAQCHTDSGRIATSSLDHSIIIYSKSTLTPEQILKSHTAGVTWIDQVSNGKLLSCSYDKSVKVWCVEGGRFKCAHTINQAHKDMIFSIIALTNNRMATCSADKLIKIWRSEAPYDLIEVLSGHTRNVYSIIQLKGKEVLLSISADNSLIKWDLSVYQSELFVEVYTCDCNCIVELGKSILIGGMKCSY